MRKRSPNSMQTFAENFINNRSERNFLLLFNRMAPAMRKYVYDYIKDYHVTESAVLNSFAKIWNRIDQYNDEYAFSTWAYRIARNEALMIVNSNKKTYSIESMEDMGIELTSKCSDLSVDPDYEFFGKSQEDETSELYDTVLEAIERLPIKYKITLELRLIEEMKLGEIAEKTGWPENTVKTRLRKGLSLLKNKVRANEPKLVEKFMLS